MIYKILKESSIEVLEREVNKFLKNGWSLQGGPFTIQGYEDHRHGVTQWESYSSSGQGTVYVSFAQAMTKIKESKEW